MKAKVILFKPGGKYYTEEEWEVPEDAITPHDMKKSPDFRRISGGAVLIPDQEPWGFPALFPNEVEYEPGRWWRVVLHDESIWCETSDEDEARKRPYGLAAAPKGSRLERLYVTTTMNEWREVQDA